METEQNSTKPTPQQQEFIDFVASGQRGLDLRKKSYQEFAESIGVDRSTLYNWRNSIQGFWDLVAERSDTVLSCRVPQILNAMLAKALKGDVAAAKLLLNQAGRLKPPPVEKEPHEYLDYSDMDVSELVDRAIGRPVDSGGNSYDDY